MVLRFSRLRVFVLCGVAALLSAQPLALPQSPQPPGAADFEPTSLQKQRAYFSQFPFEVVDVVNGNLTLQHTDLSLPGDGGFDLRIIRKYSHAAASSINTARWEMGIAGFPSIVYNPDGPEQANCAPPIICEYPMFDGPEGRQKTVPEGGLTNGTTYVTSQFWRYDRITHTVEFPNGWSAYYNEDGSPFEAKRLTEARDVYGNKIVVEWENAPGVISRRIHAIRHQIGSGERLIEFTYDGSATTMPKTMTFNGKTWSYDYVGPDQENRMSRATPPAGPSWQYAYGGAGLSGSVDVTTPHGGTVRYEFEHQELPAGTGINRLVLKRRRIGGDIWSFSYDHQVNNPGNGLDDKLNSVVNLPDGRSLEFNNDAGWGGGSGFSAALDFGPAWILRKKTLRDNGNEVSRLERDYDKLPVSPSAGLYVPKQDRIFQDGRQFTTTLSYSGSNFGDYHHPEGIEEQSEGGPMRTTTRTYDYDFNLWVRGAVASETVSVTGGGSFTTSYEYENGTGFLERQTTFGVPTMFSPDGRGNRSVIKDANNHETHIEYEWGVAKNTYTPEYAITRDVSIAGLVTKETRRNIPTSFEYDDAVG